MKVQRRLSSTTVVEAEGQTVAEVFEALARLEEIFHGHETCQLCQKSNVSYTVRQDKDGNKYYQAACLHCGGEFRFGVRKTPPGCLFPQYKDKDGNYKPNFGWYNWRESANGEPEPERPQPKTQQQPRPQQSPPPVNTEPKITEIQSRLLSSICHEAAGHDKAKATEIWRELLSRYGVTRWQDMPAHHLNDAQDWLRRKFKLTPQAGTRQASAGSPA